MDHRFFFATPWDNVAFLQHTYIKKKKKKREKEVKCQTVLAEGDNHACARRIDRGAAHE